MKSIKRSAAFLYGDMVRQHMSTANNPSGRPLSLRELAKRTTFSYEHVRKHLTGETAGSREFNRQMCEALGLDEDRMWQLLCESKLDRKVKTLGLELTGGVSRVRAAAPPPGWAVRWSQTTLIEEEDKRMAIGLLRQRYPRARVVALVAVERDHRGGLAAPNDMAIDDTIDRSTAWNGLEMHLSPEEVSALQDLLAREHAVATSPVLRQFQDRLKDALPVVLGVTDPSPRHLGKRTD